MTDKRALFLIAGLVLGLMLFPLGEVASQTIREVLVLNFPPVQEVKGKVEIESPGSELVTFEDVIVPPVKPTETTRLVRAGTLETRGFPAVVLSLHGQVKGSVLKEGEVGAILVPDQPRIQEAFDEQGLVHFALRTAAGNVSSRTPYFASGQPHYTVAFQAYRIYLYNTTDKTVNVDLHAYLTE